MVAGFDISPNYKAVTATCKTVSYLSVLFILTSSLMNQFHTCELLTLKSAVPKDLRLVN